MPLKVSVSGVRGIIGVDLDAEVVTRYVSAFGTYLPPGPIVLARDSRISGPMVAMAAKAALMSTGHDVVDIGLTTTPTTEYAVLQSDAVGGVIVTASHNPGQWNALKLLQSDSRFLDAESIAALVEGVEKGPRRHVAADQLGAVRQEEGADRLHCDGILALDLVDVEAVRAKKFKVVVDCIEGAGGKILPQLLEAMGVEVVKIGCGLSGVFPRDPEPRPDHLHELAQRVAAEDADLGLAVDPDVDRLALVDKGGRLISEERTLVLAADYILARRKAPLVVNLSTTLLLDRVAQRNDVPLYRTAVGEANVVQKMLEEGAVVGGEGNGGVILPELHPGRDALLGAALVLTAVAEAGSLSACLERYPETTMVKDKLELTPELDDPQRWQAALEALGEGRLDSTDGLKYDLADRWVHLRRSNTENALRLIAEGLDSDTPQRMIDDIKASLTA